MKNQRVYEKLDESEIQDFFKLIENLNVLEELENKLNLPPDCRILTNPNDIPPPKRSQEKPNNPPEDPITGDGEQPPSQPNQPVGRGRRLAKMVLRWVCFIPAALLAALIARLLVVVLNRFTFGITLLVDPDSFLARVFIEFISHTAMGVAFIYVGTRVAPAHHKIVACVLAGVGLVAAGLLLFPAFEGSNYWVVWDVFSILFGIGITAYFFWISE